MTVHWRAVYESIDEDGRFESVSMKTFSLDSCIEEKVFIFIGLLVEVTHLLCDIDLQHQDQPLRFFRSTGYKYAWGMMSVAL